MNLSLLLVLLPFLLLPFSSPSTIVTPITSAYVCVGDGTVPCFSTPLPSTSLSSLITSKAPGFNATSPFSPLSYPSSTAYYKDNLLSYPDAQTYNYTTVWHPHFPPKLPPHSKLMLKLGFAGHNVTISSSGQVLHSSLGNWRTREVDVTGVNLSTLTVTTRPPARPGRTSNDCPAHPGFNCGQGAWVRALWVASGRRGWRLFGTHRDTFCMCVCL